MTLLGRDVELHRIAEAIEAARSGHSRAMLVRGDAGMGKSALLAVVSERARAAGIRTREMRGVAGESEFGFAGLQRLLIPFMDGYRGLPRPQREALGAAIGLSDSRAPDRFLVGLAALTLLAETEPGRPKLLVIDDAHWLDRESLDTLVFLARRIQAESLVMVFGARAEGAAAHAFEAIETIELGGLSEETTIRLLTATAGATAVHDVGRQVAAGTAGCPLAVMELARDLSPAQLAGTVRLPDPLPIGQELEDLYRSRVKALPSQTQQILLLAAADSAAHLATVLAAGAFAGLSAEALDAAQSAGLVDVDATITFRHPLVRSAVYRGADPAEQRHAHALLAQVTDPDTEPDAWVWHRARSVSGNDEEVAAALEARGLEVERRGSYSAVAALLARAAELTPDPRVHARRTQAAADAFLAAGAYLEAGALLEQVRVQHAEPLVRARGERLRAAITFVGRPVDALATLVETAQALQTLEPELARITYAEGLALATIADHLAPPGLVDRLAASALASLEPDESSFVADVIRALGTRLAGDFAGAVVHVRTAARWLSQPDPPGAFTMWHSVGGMLATELFDIDTLRRFTDERAAEQRSRGTLDLLRFSITSQAHQELVDGRFDRADALMTEAIEISRSIGDTSVAWSLVMTQELGVWRDNEATARAACRAVRSLAVSEVRAGFWENSAGYTLALLENSLGNYAAALEAAWPVFERDAISHGSVQVEVVEAAVRCGRDDLAAAALERLAERAEACGTPWAAGLHARSVALLAGDDAEPNFVRALEVLGSLPVRTDVARTHLLYGEWLRRQNRRRDAREQLVTAHDMFVEMGAPHFAGRTARELAATGATVHRKKASAGTEPLTPQESTIAHLAAGSATNREIAASLFLSPSTVDYHLRKIYRKLGVDSRRKLSDVLGVG